MSWSRYPDKKGKNGIMSLNGFEFYVDDIINKRIFIIDKIIDIYKNELLIDIDEISSINKSHDDYVWHKNGIIKSNIRFYRDDKFYEEYIKDYIYIKLKKKNDYFKNGKWNITLLSKIKDKINDIVKHLFVLNYIKYIYMKKMMKMKMNFFFFFLLFI